VYFRLAAQISTSASVLSKYAIMWNEFACLRCEQVDSGRSAFVYKHGVYIRRVTHTQLSSNKDNTAKVNYKLVNSQTSYIMHAHVLRPRNSLSVNFCNCLNTTFRVEIRALRTRICIIYIYFI